MADDLTFAMPDGFTPPENLDSDNTFQAMATFRLVGDSQLELVDIEGYQVGEEDTEEDTEAAAKTDQQNVAAALQGAGAQGGGGPAVGAQGAPPGGAPTGAPAGLQAAQPSFGEQMRARFRAATGKR
jgi:hypothetical protein